MSSEVCKMKKTGLAFALLTSVAAVTLSPGEARAEEPWREFEYHWKDDHGSPLHLKMRFSGDGRWEGDFNADGSPCDKGGGSCEVAAVLVVKAKDGRWLYFAPVGAAGPNGLHIHKQGKEEWIKKHFHAFSEKDAKGQFTTESSWRWKWEHKGVDWKQILADIKTGLKITGEAVGIIGSVVGL
jgi:hypothetical protein